MKVHFAHKSLRRFALLSMFLILFGTLASMASNLNGDLNSFFNLTYSSILSPFGARAGSTAPANQAFTTVDPAVTTDKARYLAGESVLISGSGYLPGQTVALRVIHNDDSAEPGGGHDTFSAVADQSGAFQASWPVGLDSAGHFYKLLVDGVHSGKFGRVANANADKIDYQPGETALLSLEGFNPNEAVTIQVTHVNGQNDGAGHEPFTVNADQSGRVSATWYVNPDDSQGQIFRLKAVGAISGIETYTSFTDALVQINDDAGPDDEPGQKDLSFLRVDNVIVGGIQAIGWGWDDVQWTGNNSGDACALYDNDGDGFANFALCVTISQTITSPPPTFQRYTCTNTKTDRCTGPTAVVNNGSVGSASIVNDADPFRLNPAHTSQDCKGTDCVNDDAVAAVSVLISDVGGVGTRLTNICSYPSQQPNSDPSDCVVNPNNGLLTIVKVAPAGDTTQFTFNASAPSQTNLSSWNIVGSGTVSSISYAPGSTLDLNEAVPAGYNLSGASCVLQTQPNSPTGTPTPTGVDNITIQSSVETICTFTNARSTGKLELKKALLPSNDSGRFNLAMTNSANQTVASATNVGDGGTTGAGGTTLNSGTYNLSETAAGTTNLSFYESTLACVNRADNSSVTVTSGNVSLLAGADVVCTFTNKLKRLEIDKSGTLDVGTNGYANPGDVITYTFVVTNTGAATLNGITVSDQLPGLTPIICSPQSNGSITLTPGQSITCSATYAITQTDIDAGAVNNTAIACDNSTTCSPPTCPPGAPTCDSDLEIEPIPGKLIVRKVVVNDNGGTKIATDFSFQLNAGVATSFVQDGGNTLAGENIIGFPVGNGQVYSVVEPAVTGYSPSYSNCTGTVSNGETKTCTITNNDNAPSLTLVKEVINDNGGTAVAANWTLTATGYDSGSPDAGTYNLSESGGPSGYTQTSLTCSNSGTAQVTSVTLGLGESVTCTFVNNDNAPSLTLVKEVVNDNGGTAVAANWTLTAAGYDPASPDAGTYNLSESGGPSGYTQTSLTCSDTGIAQVTSVTLGLGENVTCTFVNNDNAPSLTLVKQVVNDNGGTAQPSAWTLTAAGYDPQSPDLGTYNLSESGGPVGYTLTSLTCSNSGSAQVTSVTLGLGESVTCTFINDDNAPSLTLVKQVVNDNGGTALPSAWTLTAAGYDPASPDVGTYNLSESGGPSGYSQTSLTCSDTGTAQVTSVTLGLGESVTCTFVNDDIAPQLTLFKRVINDNGGTAGVLDFALSTTAGALQFGAGNPDGPFTTRFLSVTLTNLSAGAKTLHEGTLAGYTNGAWTCINNDLTPHPVISSNFDTGSVQLNLGENVTCGITNDDIAPTLTLVKTVVNDDGGTLGASAFPAFVNGNPVTWGAANTLSTGSYTASETQQFGYAAGAWGGDCAADGTVTLAVGQNKTCTITNDDIAPRLTLIKTVVNDNGGTLGVGNFPLFINGSPATSGIARTLAAGSYTASETQQFGYAAGPWGGHCAANGSVTLNVGESKTCTITNDDIQPQLIVRKFVINNNGGGSLPGAFTMIVTPTGTPAPSSTPAPFPGSNAGTAVALNAGPVHVDEIMPVGPQAYAKSYPASFVFGGQTLTNDCNSEGNVTVGVGQTKTCIVVNDDLAQTLVTSSSLCTFDVDPSTTDREFRLLFTPDVQSGGNYKLNATNPGQTYYNVFYAPVNPVAQETITLTIPYPYVTKGATPIHIYGDDTVVNTANGQQCIVPGTGIGSRQDQIVLGGETYDDFGDTKTVDVTFNWPAGETFVYINIHLDYGLKGTSPYQKNANSDAVNPANVSDILIPNGQCYTFEANNSQPLADDEVCSVNSFKKNPGVGGATKTSSEEPIPGQMMQLYNPAGALVKTGYTDEDGWYFLQFKHTGRTAIYTVKWHQTGQTKQVELRSNGMVQVDFP